MRWKRESLQLNLRLVMLAGILVAAGTLALSLPVQAQDSGEGVVIVQLDDQQSRVRTIAFTPPISGITALELTGLEVITAETSFGAAVCSIEGVGCPAEDCFCDDQQFWAYSAWDGSAWQPYEVGAGTSAVRAGAVEGWRWGPFESPQTPADVTLAAQAGLDWLAAEHGNNPGLDNAGGAVDTMLVLGANGLTAAAWPAGGEEAVERFIRAEGAAYAAGGAAESGKLAVAVAAAGSCWPAGAPQPGDYYEDALGSYSTETGFHLWGLLGALALGDDVPAAATQLVIDRQQPDGGWEWSEGWGTDTNTTALAVQALIAVGLPVDAPEIRAAVAFLRTAQGEDGGFVYDPAQADNGSDANSTAYAVQALWAAAEDVMGSDWSVDGATPIDYLLAAQLEDGSFEWQPGTGANALATQQAGGALLGGAFPLRTMAEGSLAECGRAGWPAWFEGLMRMPLTPEAGE
jgi:hypothetical protein